MSELMEKARRAAENAYCPYSHFPVGAAVETDLGVFVGCNIENASYGLTACAERVALFNAVAAGAKEIRRLAVSCLKGQEDDAPNAKTPCGACRQVMAEFMPFSAVVEIEGVGELTLAEILPFAFQLAEQPFLKGRQKETGSR